MANLYRAFAVPPAGKTALKQIDKTATLDATIVITPTTVGKNLGHCTLDAPIVLTLTSAVDVFPTKAVLDAPIAFTSATAGDVVGIGTLDATIPIILTGVADYGQNALLDKPIVLTLAGIAKTENKGQLTKQLTEITAMTLAGVGDVQPLAATLAKPVIVLTLVGKATNTKATLAKSISFTLTATESDPRTSSAGAGATTLPSFTGDAVSSTAPINSVTLPAFTGNAVLAGANTYDAAATMPAFTGSSNTGHSSSTTLPVLIGSAQLDSGKIATSITALPALTANAVLVPDTSARSITTLPLLTGSSTVVSISSGSALQILPKVVGDAVLLAGLELTSDTTLPLLISAATLINGQFLVSVLTLPALTANAVMDNGAALITTTHVFNTENMAATEYSNYDFIAMSMFNGVPVGISSTGVFELTGANDNGTDIAVDVLSGFDDLGTEDLKRMPNAYLGFKSDGAIQFQVSIDGEPAVRTYNVAKVSSTSGIKRGRVKVAKGLKSRYWQVGVKNVAGSDIELEDLGLYTQQFKRKVQ